MTDAGHLPYGTSRKPWVHAVNIAFFTALTGIHIFTTLLALSRLEDILRYIAASPFDILMLVIPFAAGLALLAMIWFVHVPDHRYTRAWITGVAATLVQAGGNAGIDRIVAGLTL